MFVLLFLFAMTFSRSFFPFDFFAGICGWCISVAEYICTVNTNVIIRINDNSCCVLELIVIVCISQVIDLVFKYSRRDVLCALARKRNLKIEHRIWAYL